MRRRMAYLLLAPILLASLLVGAGPALAQDNPYPGTTTVTSLPATSAPVTLAPLPSVGAAPSVAAPHGGLAFTGLDVIALVAAALSLIAAGTALLMWRRRQNTTPLWPRSA